MNGRGAQRRRRRASTMRPRPISSNPPPMSAASRDEKPVTARDVPSEVASGFVSLAASTATGVEPFGATIVVPWTCGRIVVVVVVTAAVVVVVVAAVVVVV